MNHDVEFDYLTRHRSFLEMGRLARASYAGTPRHSHMDAALWRAFPRGYVGGWVDGALRAVIQLWPLDERRAAEFLAGGVPERELTDQAFATVCNSHATVWYFSGLILEPDWRGRGLAAHLLAEALVRWHRDLPWRAPVRFAALGASPEGLAFIHEFGMERRRAADAMADGLDLYGRTFAQESDLFAVVAAARAAADRKGRVSAEPMSR